MAVGKTSFQVALVISPLPTAGNGEALLLGSFAFGGMPETSEARGRAGGGLAPQEGFALGNFQKKAELSTDMPLCNKDLSCLYRSFLFVAPLEPLVCVGCRVYRCTNSQFIGRYRCTNSQFIGRYRCTDSQLYPHPLGVLIDNDATHGYGVQNKY